MDKKVKMKMNEMKIQLTYKYEIFYLSSQFLVSMKIVLWSLSIFLFERF